MLDDLKRDYESEKTKSTELKTLVEELTNQIKSKQTNLYQLRKTLEISQVQQSTLKQELEREASDTSERTASLAEFDEQNW